MSERTGEQTGVIEMPKICAQESIVVTSVFREQFSERKCERIGVFELPKISNQESLEIVKSIPQERIVEAVENIPQERISVRRSTAR